MMRHRKIQAQLYDFIKGEIDNSQRAIIESHLSRCDRCREMCKSMQSVLDLTVGRTQPADQRPAEFWQTFSLGVQNRTRSETLVEPSHLPFRERLSSIVVPNRRFIFSMGGALAAIGLVAFLWRPWHNEGPLDVAAIKVVQTKPVKPDRVGQYFRRSKMLLVGLSNMREIDDTPLDVSLEQKVSRELVHEARTLRTESLDPHSLIVLNDLNKILIELANIEQQGSNPQIEIVMNGIQRENLLFRLRMAETVRDSLRFMYARNNE